MTGRRPQNSQQAPVAPSAQRCSPARAGDSDGAAGQAAHRLRNGDFNLQDRKLPALQQALDDKYMRHVFQQLVAEKLRNAAPDLQQVRHAVLKYKPGKTCVIEYALYFAGEGPCFLIGKMYRKARGKQLFAYLWGLWERGSRRMDAPNFSMAEPVAYVSELGMVLQKKLSGWPLETLNNGKALYNVLPAVAANLAALHELPLRMAKEVSFAEFVDKFCPQRILDGLAAWPLLQHRLTRLRARLQEAVPVKIDAPCLVHGDLNLSQVFLQGEHVAFVDFDGLCRSVPAIDVANFMTTLLVKFVQSGDKLSQHFLRAYLRARELASLPNLSLCQALAYTRRAFIGARHKTGPTWEKECQALIDAAEVHLERSHAESAVHR